MSHIQKAHAAKAIHQSVPLPSALTASLTEHDQPTSSQTGEQSTTQDHHVVALETMYVPPPKFDIPHTYTEHYRTPPELVLERIRDATIVISIMTPITAELAAQCPRLRLILVMATGYAWVDGPGLSALGITVMNCPQSNIPAVSEHTLGLYFAVRKRIAQVHHLTTSTDLWATQGTLTGCWETGPPLSCAEETVGIVGYGALGKRIEGLMNGVGMGQVLIAERRSDEVREGRVAFEEVLRKASVLVICCIKDASTENLIQEAELKAMRRESILINMARGGIVNEAALAKALRERWIDGAATDVLENEPGVRGESPLLPTEGEGELPNFVISPHVSWFASRTITTLKQLTKDGVEGFVAGRPVNVVAGPGEQ